MGLIVWWISAEIVDNPGTWWQITIESLATVLTEWIVVVAVLVGLNWWMSPLEIHKPKNRTLAKVLGFFFVLKPFRLYVPPPSIHTPQVPIAKSIILIKARYVMIFFAWQQLDSDEDANNNFALFKKGKDQKRTATSFGPSKVVTSDIDV